MINFIQTAAVFRIFPLCKSELLIIFKALLLVSHRFYDSVCDLFNETSVTVWILHSITSEDVCELYETQW
jgi:hypothetical protein